MKLPISCIKQEYSFSCVASVLQMVMLHYFTGDKLSHEKAIELTKCNPDGACLDVIGKILNCGVIKPSTLKELENHLDSGNPIICNDKITYEDDHAILLIGYTKTGFWIADPAKGKVYHKLDSWLIKAADEFLVLDL